MKVNEIFSPLQLPVKSHMPSFEGANAWLNTEPLTADALRGKVVAVDFWTFTCINWLRTLPYIRAWANTYSDKGLVVIGVHTPEFGVEHDLDNVRRAVRAMGIEYPVAIDNDYAVWNAFANQYWPALYIADAEGRVRHHEFGEGGYDKSERVIRQLLTDAGAVDLPAEADPVEVNGIEAAADWSDVRSPETYVGLARSSGFASRGGAAFDEARIYEVPEHLHLNEWGLGGSWTVGREEATSNEPNGRIAYRFHARDLHLILTPPSGGSARFRVTLDGQVPGDAHGLDVDEQGEGAISEPRLHQLIRQGDKIGDRLFEIEFVDPGAAALCFTFG
jgi:thiol-disulfide isomerase/thioredoxin